MKIVVFSSQHLANVNAKFYGEKNNEVELKSFDGFEAHVVKNPQGQYLTYALIDWKDVFEFSNDFENPTLKDLYPGAR